MFIDTSVLVAIFALEPDGISYRNTIVASRSSQTSVVVLLEAAMVLSTRLDAEPTLVLEKLLGFLAEASVDIVPLEGSHARIAVQAFQTYGKGRGHPAQLNLADCLSYACAKLKAVPMLYKGDDFARTDLAG